MNPAPTIVRGWVDLYTRGMPRELRQARRAEIESDLWAHAEEAFEGGNGPNSLELEMVTRLVLGIPADIAWRMSHRIARVTPDSKEITMHEPRSHHMLTAIGIGVAVILAGVFGLVSVVPEMAWSRPIAAVLIGGYLTAVVGLFMVTRRPILGAWLAVVGSIVVGGIWILSFQNDGAFVVPVAILMSAPIGVIGVIRAGQVLMGRRQQPA